MTAEARLIAKGTAFFFLGIGLGAFWQCFYELTSIMVEYQND